MGQVTLGDLNGYGVVFTTSGNGAQYGSGTGSGSLTQAVVSNGSSGTSSGSTKAVVNAPLSTIVSPTTDSTLLPTSAATVAIGPTPLVLQAIDEAVATWPSKGRSNSH